MNQKTKQIEIFGAQHFRTEQEARSWARRIGLRRYRIERHYRPRDRDHDSDGMVRVIRLLDRGVGVLDRPRHYA